MQNLDAKFHGIVVRNDTAQIVPPDRWVAFMAYDLALVDTLKFYRQKCVEIGADGEQLAAVDRLLNRVKTFQHEHPELCKVPDAVPGECH